MTAACRPVLLIGDHQQLRPSVACHELTLRHNFNVSLFERCFNNGVPFVRLRTQRRMRPEISRLIRDIYPTLRGAFIDYCRTFNSNRPSSKDDC